MSRLWEKGLPLDERVLRYTAGEDHLLDARLVVEAMAVDHLDDEMGAGEHSPVLPDEMIIAVLVEDVARGCSDIAAEVFRKNGMPEGISCLINGDYRVGEFMTHDERIPLISATGSIRMGT